MADDRKRNEELEPEAQPSVQAEEAEKTDAEKLLALAKEHGQSVLIGLGIAVAIVLGVGAYRNYQRSIALRSSQMLLGARTPEQIQQVIQQYPSTPTAPIAQLTLAGAYFDASQFDLARLAYDQFLQRYPAHPMRQSAELGRAQCLEASEQWEQAIGAFDAFVAAYSNHYLTALAYMGKARCYTQQGLFREAKAVYEDFIAAHPQSRWLPLAENAMIFVDKEMRAQAKGLAKEEVTSNPSAVWWPRPEASQASPPLLPSAAEPAR